MGLRDQLRDGARGLVSSAASAALSWAGGPTLAGEEFEKAAGANRDQKTAGGQGGIPTDEDLDIADPKAMFWDPFAVIEQLGYKERPTAITYGTLRSIVYRMPIIQSIIQTRVNQVASFAQPQHDRYDLGFRVKNREPEDKPTGADKKWSKDAESLLMHTGIWSDPRHRDSFETFLKKITTDSLIYDQDTFEVVPNRKGTPAQWVAVDASSIRLADTATAYMKKKIRSDTKYVQIYDGMIVNEYTENELCFGVRNPKTDMRLYGYGTSELEMLMSTITSLLWAWQYNQKFFSQGSATKGILNFKGAIPERQLKGFRRHWYNMLSGVENAWRTPVTNAESLEWIDLHSSNRDMEFNAWMDFLIKVACFTPDTRVTRSDGSLVCIDSIEPGDSVITLSGRSQRVTNTQVTEFDGHLTCLRMSGSDVVKATPEHPFYVASSRTNSWMGRDFDDPEWVKASDIVAGKDYLVVPKARPQREPVTEIDLRKYIVDPHRELENGKLKPNSNRSNAVPAKIPLTSDNAFVLGLFAAEGSASNRSNLSWSFHEDETSYVEVTQRFINEVFGLMAGRADMPEKHVVQIRCSSVLLSQAFKGLFGQYSKTRKVPNEIIRASDEIQRSFLSGALAGDGCVRDTGRTVVASIATVSRRYAEQLRHLLLGQGVWAGIYTSTKGNTFENALPMHDVRVQGRYVLALAEWLTGEKSGKLAGLIDQVLQKKGQGVGLKSHVHDTPGYFYVPVVESWDEPYQGPVFNMEVENDHTYQVERFAVHNCSAYQMDPVEVNFKYGNTGQKGGLNEASNKEKITESKERGLRPLLRAIAAQINRHLIWPMNENFVFEFVGLDSKTHDEVADLHTKQVKSTRTIDELRAEDDLEPLPDGLGEIILDPTWMQAYQANKQAEMGIMPGQEGAPGEGPPGANGNGKDEDEDDDKFDFAALLEQEQDDDDDDDDEDEPTKKSMLVDRKTGKVLVDRSTGRVVSRHDNRVIKFDVEL